MSDAVLPGFEAPAEAVDFTPTREAGLRRLAQFTPRTGRHYAGHRNYDYGPERRSNVSALSPWIRHRLITEEEVLRATLSKFAPSTAEKFVQEVFWRGYFKGWMEQRPSVWDAYKRGVAAGFARIEAETGLASDYMAAIEGRTGIDCFDAWMRELVATGYLHNHARMWAASIWIFTLKLPWELGADFFLRHLVDGDPASNTLSWRWVGGLHTKGKTYLARAANIAKYTEGRFRPAHHLASEAPPLTEAMEHPRCALPHADAMPDGRFLLLITEEDGRPSDWLTREPAGVVGLLATAGRSMHGIGTVADAFAKGALQDALAPYTTLPPQAPKTWAPPLIEAAEAAGVRQIVTAYTPIGPIASRLAEAKPALAQAGVSLHLIRRPYDSETWPHASKGFFGLKKAIPRILDTLSLT